MHRRELTLTLFVGLLLSSCSEPGPTTGPATSGSPPTSLRVSVPAEAVGGEAFTLTVEALDEDGAVDETWSGAASLAASAGTLSPDTVQISAGKGSAQAILSGAAGPLEVTASIGALSSTSSLLVLTGEPAQRLAIEPASFLLTGSGESATLRVRAYDEAGQLTIIPTNITWRSLDEETIGVTAASDATGVARASAGSGSAQVVAQAGALTSVPSLGLVATPAAGAVLVADSQVVGPFEPVDAAAAFVPGWRYHVRVRDVSPDVGTLVIGAGEAPVAGRVVAAEPDSTDTDLTLELVSLADLFETLVIDETLPLVASEQSPARRYGLAPGGMSAAAGQVARYGLQAKEFEVGPFKCEASGTMPELDLPDPAVTITPDLTLHFAYDGNLQELAVHGQVRADFSYEPRLKIALTGEVGCEDVVRTLVLPIGGFLSLVVGAQVPIGIGLDLNADLNLADVGFDIGARAAADFQLGVTCSSGGTCSGTNSVKGSSNATFAFVSPDPDDQFRVKLGAYGYAFAKLTLGSPLSEDWQFEAFEGKAGLEQSVDLATAHKQAEDTAYASGFWLVAKAQAGPGEGITDGIDWFKKRLGVDLDVSALDFEAVDTVARSPSGSFEITPDTVAPGDTTKLGEQATFEATLDPVAYLGADAVDAVEFLWQKDDGDGGFTLEPGRPACSEVQGGGGKTTFTCKTDFLEQHTGTQTFDAFTRAELFGAPLPVPLEVAGDGRDSVVVRVECAPLASGFSGILEDTSYLGQSWLSGLESWTTDLMQQQYGQLELAMTGTASPDSAWTYGWWGYSWGEVDMAASYDDSIYIAPVDPNRLNEPGLRARRRIQYRIEATVPDSAGQATIRVQESVDAGGVKSGMGTIAGASLDSHTMTGTTNTIVADTVLPWGIVGTWFQHKVQAGGWVRVGDKQSGSAHVWMKEEWLPDGVDSNGDPVPMKLCTASGATY